MIRQFQAGWTGYRTKDWFALDAETAKPLFHRESGGLVPLPGVRVADTRGVKEVFVHRSHLPLLTSPEALRLLTLDARSDWDARNRFLAQFGIVPRVTQHQAIDFIAPRRGVLLADDMRLGKTFSCVASHDIERGQLIVVGPLATRPVWLGWIRRRFPDVPIGVLTGKKPDRKKLDQPIVFCHYDILKDWQTVRPIGTLVFDEAHALKSAKADRSKAAVLFAARAEKIIATTGTPIWGFPPDLWNIIGILAPAAWGSYFDFGMRYGDPAHNGYGVEFRGATNVDELNARLNEIKLRRLWREVVTDLPPISRSIVVADLDEPVRRKLDVLAGKLKTERSNTAANLALYRSQLCKVKLAAVVKEAKRYVDNNTPVVVWTYHKEFASDIADALDGILVHGEVPQARREERLDEWRKSTKALVVTMSVAREGLDFSHARDTVFAELDYVPLIVGQAEMRTFDATRPMNVTFVVANHFVDQRLVRALITKLGATDPLGFGAAVDAIDALREAFEGPIPEPDMDRFLDDIISSGIDQ